MRLIDRETVSRASTSSASYSLPQLGVYHGTQVFQRLAIVLRHGLLQARHQQPILALRKIFGAQFTKRTMQQLVIAGRQFAPICD